MRVHVYFWAEEHVIYGVPSGSGAFPLANIYLQYLSAIHFDPLIEMKYPPINITSNCIISVPQAAVGEVVEVSGGAPEDEMDLQYLSVLEVPNGCSHKSGSQPSVTVLLNSKQFCAGLDTGSELSLVSMAVLTTTGHSLDVRQELNTLYRNT